MSIYGGFPTRNIESSYNHYLFEALHLLQSIVLDTLLNHKYPEPSAWGYKYLEVFSKLEKLEKQKHLPPNFSQAMQELDEYVKSLTYTKNIENLNDKESVSNTSAASFARNEIKRVPSGHHRYTSLQSERVKPSGFSLVKKPQKLMRKTQIKSYQDQILKSILKDLSNPLYEFNNY